MINFLITREFRWHACIITTLKIVKHLDQSLIQQVISHAFVIKSNYKLTPSIILILSSIGTNIYSYDLQVKLLSRSLIYLFFFSRLKIARLHFFTFIKKERLFLGSAYFSFRCCFCLLKQHFFRSLQKESKMYNKKHNNKKY